ncbi:MAG: Prephenate dehydrogenase [Capsulimonas sp.]|jgi:prephenate dehydrogenase|nr:Prephenate dehydrogenase [Capsulimonas sp.]
MSGEGSFPTRFGTVAIVGVGLMGGSLGLALRQRRLAHRVIGVGRDAARLSHAVSLGAIDSFQTDIAVGVEDADVVVLCSTIGHILEVLPGVLQAVKPGAVVTDVGSTKTTIVEAAAAFPNFVGGHPMAGSERGGVEAATALLYQEATWAITPTDTTDPAALRIVTALAQEIGATTLLLDPKSHDAMVAVTSHLPHVLATSLMRSAALATQTLPQTPRLSAGSFADMTRVSASPAPIWRDICLTNRDAILAAIASFRGELDALEKAIMNSDAAEIEKLFAGGAKAKETWGAER